MKEEKIKNAIKAGIAITVLIITVIMVITIMLQYESEGEKNMPFELSKIAIISTAEITEVTANDENNSADNNWNLNIIQNNDVYITIAKNSNYKKEEIIKSITINNIQVQQKPKKGEIVAYMPNSLNGGIFNYSDEYKIEEQLKYNGASKSNAKTLEVGNQGGNILMSFCNIGLGTYNSKDDTEVKHDASLIQKIGGTDEDLEFTVSFDLTIELEKKSYKGTVTLDLPCEELTEKGTTSREITNFDEIIFKRVN